MFTAIIVSLLGYMTYIELSPGMGNIWYRYNSDNKKYISISSLVNILVYPLYDINMWYPKLWDINYFIWLLITYYLFIIIK